MPISSNILPAEPTLVVNNVILAKVNGHTISVLDVMKRMDMIFHHAYPQYADSKPSKYQFYQMSWEKVLNDMVNTELILADGEDKEIKISEGEVREEVEMRFGPNTMATLDKIGITMEEAMTMVKNDMMVQRMNWFFVHSKALQGVTPNEIRKAYKEFCQKNPPVDQWNYQVITVKADDKETAAKLADKAYHTLQQNQEDPSSLFPTLKDIATLFPSVALQISPEYTVDAKDLAEAHLAALKTLTNSSVSEPIEQKSRFDTKNIFRIFYLKEHHQEDKPEFTGLSVKLRDELLDKYSANQTTTYLEKLRKYYSHGQPLLEKLPDNFQPFIVR